MKIKYPAILAAMMATPAFATSIFINEFHYDNVSTDVGEFIEVVAPDGTDLTGYSVVLYNGSNGTVYSTETLSGSVASMGNGFGTYSISYPSNGIQNGAPDGIALVDNLGQVIQFLSYEGTMTASGGPADGLTSEDIGVSQTSSTPVGASLQLTGNGIRYSDFTWQAFDVNTQDAVNTDQSFDSDPVIFFNELHYDNAGADVGEFIEVAGTAGMDLTGMSIVLYNGNGGGQYDSIALSGVMPDNGDGFGTLAYYPGSIQNGSPDGMALIAASGEVIQFLSYEGTFTATDGPAEGMLSTDIGIAQSSSTEAGTSLQLSGSGFAYADFSWISGIESPNETNPSQAFGSGDGDGGDDGDGDDNGTDIGQCGDTATLISAVQGSGAASPMDGQTVIIEAVVTQLLPGYSAFTVQEEDADQDGDSATSEGLVVYYGSNPISDVNVGDLIRISGTVDEYFDLTELTNISASMICSPGHSVTPATLTLPVNDLSEIEAIEGMLVNTTQTLTVSEVYELGRYGQFMASSGGRLQIPTNVVAPGEAAIAMQAQNDLNKIIIDDGSSRQNPESVIFPAPELSAINPLRIGTDFAPLTGVMYYSFGDYLLVPNQAPTFVDTNPRTSEPADMGGTLKVASFNVLNYFNGDGQGEGFPTSRGADSLEEFIRQEDKIVQAISALDADIIGLMEIENDGYGEYSAIASLVDAVNAELGEERYAYTNPGVPVIGTDAIAVGLIYNQNTVKLQGSSAILDSTVDATFIDDKNRPALAQTFVQLETNARLTVVVNHLKSKGSACDDVNDPDTGDGQGNCNLTRTAAAEALVNWLATDPTNSNDSDYLIIGDLNSYAMEDPITAIKNAGYTDLISTFNPGGYSYVFDGQTGYLDHALASSSLVEKVVGVTEWHINTDEPLALDYNVEFKSDAQVLSFYAPDAYRSSDHDPVIVSLDLGVLGDFDGDGDVDQDDFKYLVQAIAHRELIDSSFDFNNDGKVNMLDARFLRTLCTRKACRTE